MKAAIPCGACILNIQVTLEEVNSELHIQLRGHNMEYISV
jgi:hypothetical protein